MNKKSHRSIIDDTNDQVARLTVENEFVKNLNIELQSTVSDLEVSNFDYERLLNEQTSLMKELNVRGIYLIIAALGLIVLLIFYCGSELKKLL